MDVADLPESGSSQTKILENFSDIEPEGIASCLEYAAAYADHIRVLCANGQ
jgi:uncharacterized protein (DUF433 family)